MKFKNIFLIIGIFIFLFGCSNISIIKKISKDNRLIPLYSYPDYWYKNSELLNNTTVIINPDNGPGIDIDLEYEKGISFLKEKNTTVYGYVFTGYGERNIETIKEDILKWKKFYNIDGIFFDETPTNEEFLSKYIEISDYAKSLGIRKIILNPGITTSQKYIDCNNFDIIITLEVSSSEVFDTVENNIPSDKTVLAALIYDYSNSDKIINELNKRNFKYIYLTPDTLPNPWDTISNIK